MKLSSLPLAYILVIFLMLIMILFSSCEKINESNELLPSGTVTAQTTVSPVVATSLTTMTSATTTADTTTVSSTAPTEAPTTTTVAQTTAATTTTKAPPETEATTTQATTEATKLSLQSESPPETENVTYSPAKNGYSALNYTEQKGVWISFLEYESILKNRTKSQFEASINEYFNNIVTLGFNTVYIQVRSHGDAYYDSELYPDGKRFTGSYGAKASFDPLEIMVQKAHERKLSVHAWVNPMRLMSESEIAAVPSEYPIKKWYDSDTYFGQYIVKSGEYLYLNPAYSEVRDLIANGISEIVANYDVDGIQIDDYFYPTTDSSFDRIAFKAYGNNLSLSDYRFANVDSMVKLIYDEINRVNSSVLFGISPQGIVKNNYEAMYADVEKWASVAGYCDYILPQIYFGFDNSAAPFSDLAEQWSEMVTSDDVMLVIGLAAYKSGTLDKYAGDGKYEWQNSYDILSSQMDYAKTLENYSGVALFRYGSLFEPASDVKNAVEAEIENIKS